MMRGLAAWGHLSIELITLLFPIVLLGYVWHRREEPCFWEFVAMLVTLAAGGLFGVIGLLLGRPDNYPLWMALQGYIGAVGFSMTWGLFALVYTGYGNADVLKSVIIATLGIAVLGAIMRYLGVFELLPAVLGSALFLIVSIVVVLIVALGAGLVFVGASFLLRAAQRYDHFNLPQAVFLVVAGIAPIVGNFLTGTVQGEFGSQGLATLDYYAGGFLIAEIALATVVVRYPLFSLVTAAGRIGIDHAIDEMSEGVVLTDTSGRILDTNVPAEKMFGHENEDVIGQPVKELFDAVTDAFDPRTENGAHRTAELDPSMTTAEFEARVSSVTADSGDTVGSIIVLRDITDRKLREQRLEVLNRVLRHNLRNDMGVITTHTELLEEGGIDPEEAAPSIRQTARELIDVSKKVQTIEEVLADQSASSGTIELTELVSIIADDLGREFPETEITTDLPSAARISNRPGVVEAVVEEAVRNAALHNDSSDPRVEIGIELDDEIATIRIADNGPGIPPHERKPVLEGGETELEHSSGLGLWLMKWGVNQLGGSIGFSENDPRGTVVDIRLQKNSGGLD